MNLLVDGIKSNMVIKTDRATKMTVDGLTGTYPIYQIKLDLLFFNDQNDRVATWISQYESEHGKGSLCPEGNHEVYNATIQSFIEESNPERMKQTQVNINLIGQQKYGVVLTDGRIIDGNRRFSCLRNLAKEDPKFGYFEAVILERDYEKSAKQIKMLELQIQIGAEERVDYNPIDRLVGIYRDIEETKLLTVDEYAKSTNQPVKEIEKQLDQAKLLAEYLESINCPGQYHMAREANLNGPLLELQGILREIKDPDKRQQVKYIIFANLLMSPTGDMTRFVRKAKSIADSAYVDEFIEKESDAAEEVLDKLSEKEAVTTDDIAEIRADQEIKDTFEQTMDVVYNKVKVTETRNKPNMMLVKAVNDLEAIDIRLLRKLSEEQIESMRESLERLTEKLEEVKEAIENV